MLRCKNSPEDSGLLAVGSSEEWSISVDESVEGETQFTVEIDGPQFYVTFSAKNLAVINDAASFLQQGLIQRVKDLSSLTLGELSLGNWGNAAVSPVWDN